MGFVFSVKMFLRLQFSKLKNQITSELVQNANFLAAPKTAPTRISRMWPRNLF